MQSLLHFIAGEKQRPTQGCACQKLPWAAALLLNVQSQLQQEVLPSTSPPQTLSICRIVLPLLMAFILTSIKKKKVQVFFTQVRFLPKAEPIQTGKERGLSGLRSWGQGQEAGRRKRNSTSWCLKALPSRNAETIAASSWQMWFTVFLLSTSGQCYSKLLVCLGDSHKRKTYQIGHSKTFCIALRTFCTSTRTADTSISLCSI